MSKKRTLTVALSPQKKSSPRKLVKSARGSAVAVPFTAAEQQASRQQAMNRRLQAQNRATMGFLGIEKKFYDTTLAATALVAPTDAAGGELDPSATSMISTPTQGDGEQQRDGKQITCDYVQIKGNLFTASAEASANPPPQTSCILYLVLDTQTNGAQMNSEDCFKNLSANATGAASALRNLLFGKRFKVLQSEVFEFEPNFTTAGADSFSFQGLSRSFDWYVPLNSLKINFNAQTTASVANVIDNSLHVIGYTTSTIMAPAVTYNARIRFMG